MLSSPIKLFMNALSFSMPKHGSFSRFICIMLVISLGATAQINAAEFTQADAPAKDGPYPYQLLLAGGALSTCSSFSKQNCTQYPFFENAKTQLLYEINASSIDRLDKFAQNLSTNDAILLSEIVLSLQNFIAQSSLEKIFSRDDLNEWFESIKLNASVNNLTDANYFALLDHLEVAQFDEKGVRLKEQADVYNTSNQDSVTIYQRFVKEVSGIAKKQGQTPQILVITASSRDAFEVADFYQSVFTSLDVKTIWLPIDQAFAYALEKKSEQDKMCEQLEMIAGQFNVYDRKRVYPDRFAQQTEMCQSPQRLSALIANSQGVFINGGDQSKTLNSLLDATQQPLPFWQQITQLVDARKMIVGGTSAGTAVHAGISVNNMPIPMISNGSSEQAIKRGAFAAIAPSQRCLTSDCNGALAADDLTYLPSGGSGLFKIGTLDTHFSERDREGRLIALALQTATRLAVGVDETTALLYKQDANEVTMEVIGAGGVFIVDGLDHVVQTTVSSGKRQVQYAGFSHYFFSGNTFSLDLTSNQWNMDQSATPIDERKSLGPLQSGVWRNSIRDYCGSKEMTSWTSNSVQYVLAPQNKTTFFIDDDRSHCGYMYLPFLLSYGE